jgi:2-polyprenyl-6-methoxyphenol hydroxylase-like FAD-dependent oxidoreductase
MSGPEIVIVGGGIAGLACALALEAKGCNVLVLERSDEFREIGAGIQLGPNGLRMLRHLGIADAIERFAVRPDSLVVMDGVTATEVTRIQTGDEFCARFAFPYTLIHRADLHRVLLEACLAKSRIELRAGVTMTRFERLSDGSVEVSVSAKPLKADAMVGADGIWSQTRAAVVGDGAPVVSGHIAYRAVLPISEIDEAYRQNAMMLWAGPKNHLVQYPLRGGKLFNLVAVFHSDRYVEGWDRQGDPEELAARFAGNCDTVRRLLAKVDTWRMWVLCDRDPVRNWHQGNVVLIGDAAHPMLQYLAQGAGMSLEDALILAECVAKDTSDIPAAFSRFSELRYRRTARCQILARIYGGFYHASGIARELRNDFLAARSQADSIESLSWLYDYDPLVC